MSTNFLSRAFVCSTNFSFTFFLRDESWKRIFFLTVDLDPFVTKIFLLFIQSLNCYSKKKVVGKCTKWFTFILILHVLNNIPWPIQKKLASSLNTWEYLFLKWVISTMKIFHVIWIMDDCFYGYVRKF